MSTERHWRHRVGSRVIAASYPARAAGAGPGRWPARSPACFAFRDLRRDVFPDLSAPVFNVIVQNPAMGAEELETGIAIPMEVALAGLPDVRRIRSSSQLGVSQVTVEFEARRRLPPLPPAGGRAGGPGHAAAAARDATRRCCPA